MRLGDLWVTGEPPIKLVKALAVISTALHSELDKVVIPGKSKESCVLCSLTVRDFLWRWGFKDAKLSTVYLAVSARDAAGAEIHSLGVGDHEKVPTRVTKPLDTRGRWSGHMVVTVPSAGYLIDTTMFPMKRPAWDNLPGMMAVTLGGGWPAYGMQPLAGVSAERADNARLDLVWLDQFNDRWRAAPDTDRKLRAPVVKAMVALGGKRRD